MIATRRALPTRRPSWTQKARVGGTGVFVTCGEYPDGSLGEVFVSVARTGTAMRSALDALAITISLGLQHGVPLGTFTAALRGIDFQPRGVVSDCGEVTRATSVIDLLAQHLEAHYEPDGKRRATCP